MRHGKAGFKLGRVTAHRWALFRNLLVALFRHERIMTTEAKAKAVRGLADHMVTLAKRDDLHARRQVLSMVPDTVVVKKLFDTIAARFSERHGGYTRIMKAGLRPGDRAQMVVLELVDRPEEPKEKGKKDAKALSTAVKQKRKDKAAKYAVPLPKVRGIAEDEIFKVMRTGKSKKKSWKRMVTKATFVGEGFTRKPVKMERFVRPMALRYKKANVTHRASSPLDSVLHVERYPPICGQPTSKLRSSFKF